MSDSSLSHEGWTEMAPYQPKTFVEWTNERLAHHFAHLIFMDMSILTPQRKSDVAREFEHIKFELEQRGLA